MKNGNYFSPNSIAMIMEHFSGMRFGTGFNIGLVVNEFTNFKIYFQ